jgi:hypothetical protein
MPWLEGRVNRSLFSSSVAIFKLLPSVDVCCRRGGKPLAGWFRGKCKGLIFFLAAATKVAKPLLRFPPFRDAAQAGIRENLNMPISATPTWIFAPGLVNIWTEVLIIWAERRACPRHQLQCCWRRKELSWRDLLDHQRGCAASVD